MYVLDISPHHLYVANREQIRLYDRHGIMLGSVPNAKRLMQGRAERQPSGGQYLGTAVDWRIPYEEFAGDILPGSFITDSAGASFCVLAVDPPGSYFGTWNCRCVALMVLGHTITWHLATNQTDAFGSPIVDQSATLATVACAIQEVACEEILFQGIVQGFRRTYAIWLLGDITLAYGAVGVDDTGKIYTVQSVSARQRLDELIRVECVVEP